MNEFLQILRESTVTVPSYEIMVVLVLQSLCYLFRTPRIGLLVSCAFVYRLGWWFLVGHYGLRATPYFYGYALFGLLLLALALYGMFRDND